MKIRKIFFILIPAVILPGLSFSAFAAQADSYIIEINGTDAAGNRELIADYPNAGAGDVYEQHIQVVNKTADSYAVYLKRAEPSGDGGLLRELTLTFDGPDGDTVLTAENFSSPGRPLLLLVSGNADGGVMLKTRIGTLDNTRQGATCTVGFEFEIVNANVVPGPEPELPHTGGDSRIFIHAAAVIVSFVSFSVTALFSRRKKGRERT